MYNCIYVHLNAPIISELKLLLRKFQIAFRLLSHIQQFTTYP